ncbi:MAG: TetR/AcrR family transcriptional regulator [bacterium]
MSSDKPDRKEQIIVEATRLFSQAGYEGVSMKALAEACCVTEPALYRHFNSKEAIYDASLESLLERFEADKLFARLDKELELEGLLREMAAHIVGFARGNEDAYRLMLFAALGGHQTARAVFGSIRGGCTDYLKDRLQRFADEDKLAPINPEITARCFVGMVFDCGLGYTLWRGYYSRQYQPEEVFANNIPIYARGLLKQTNTENDIDRANTGGEE